MLTYVISEKFEELLTSFGAYVEDENIDVKKIKMGLGFIIRCPTIFEDDEIIPYVDFKNTTEWSDILIVIRTHCTFFNFKLLEHLIRLIQYSVGKHMMEEYKKDFCEYVQAISVSVIPHGIGMDREDCECFGVMLDETFKACRAMYIDILKRDVCKILNIKEECLYIARMNDGSSGFVYEKAKILKVGYDRKVHVINTDTSEGENINIFVTGFISYQEECVCYHQLF